MRRITARPAGPSVSEQYHYRCIRLGLAPRPMDATLSEWRMALADACTVRPDSFFKKKPLWLSRASRALIQPARDRVTGDTTYLQRFAST